MYVYSALKKMRKVKVVSKIKVLQFPEKSQVFSDTCVTVKYESSEGTLKK